MLSDEETTNPGLNNFIRELLEIRMKFFFSLTGDSLSALIFIKKVQLPWSICFPAAGHLDTAYNNIVRVKDNCFSEFSRSLSYSIGLKILLDSLKKKQSYVFLIKILFWKPRFPMKSDIFT